MVKLTPELQRTFIEKAPEVFRPSSGGWGRQGYTNVYLPFAKTNIVRAALEAAAKNVASKKKKTPNVEHPTPNAQRSRQRRFTAATGRFEKMRSRTSVEMRQSPFHRCEIG